MRSRRHRFDIAATAKTAVFLPPSLGWGRLCWKRMKTKALRYPTDEGEKSFVDKLTHTRARHEGRSME